MISYLLLLICLSFFISRLGQTSSFKRELRKAWIATFSNIHWPVKFQASQQQISAFLAIIKQLQATGVNVFYIQVRSLSDALYSSALEPWSADLTGMHHFIVCPNPANHQFNLRFPVFCRENKAKVFILDLSGRKVFRNCYLSKDSLSFIK